MSPIGKEDRKRKVFVTGAAQGIGRGLVDYLLHRRFSVVAADIDEPGLRVLRDEFASYAARGSLVTRTLNVQLESSLQLAQADLDDTDVLINNAGLQHVSRLEEFPPEKWDQLVSVMLTGSARLMRGVLPGMRRRAFGRIINIGSVHSLVASAYKSAYVAAKHGLIGLSKVVALETCDTEITVNTICPSYVRTALVERQIDQQASTHGIPRDEVIQRIMLAPMPKRRFIEIEEIGAAVEFLAGDLARNITGQCLVIDGGWTSQ